MTEYSYSEKSLPKSWGKLALFVLLSYAVFAFGGLFQPGDWYLSLNRAPWSPPNIAFPIVWFILYGLIAIAGWLVYAQSSRLLKWAWALQLLLNSLWSWIFFEQHWVLAALVSLFIITFLVLLLIVQCYRKSMRIVTWVLCPYLAWLLIATSLNSYVLLYN